MPPLALFGALALTDDELWILFVLILCLGLFEMGDDDRRRR